MGESLNVNVGDKLILHGNSEIIVTVTKITPTGRIRIDKSDSQFDKFGWEMRGSDIWRARRFLSLPTENDFKRIRETKAKNRALSLMRETKQSSLTYEQALKIIEILDVKNDESEVKQ